jgi:hypothetical protein
MSRTQGVAGGLRIAENGRRLMAGLSRYSVSKVKIWTAPGVARPVGAAIVVGPPGD